MSIKLDLQHKHIMRLIERGKRDNGWTPVSDVLFPHLSNNMPPELVEFTGVAGCYEARLTEKGNDVLMAMEWL